MDKYNCVFWLLLGLFIGWVAHWLLTRFFCSCKCSDQTTQVAAKDAKAVKAKTSGTASSSKMGLTSGATPPTFTTKGGSDNLQKIEGIGPKIATLLQADGIATFAALSTTSTDRLRSILDKAGPSFKIANPSTWPEQAAYIVRGDLAGLEKFQNALKGGVRQG